MGEGLGVVGDIRTFGGIKVVDHAVVEGEEGGGSTNFGAHVTNRSHTRARQRLDTRAPVFNNSTSSTLDSENTSNLENDI